jgi:hypothetical protein
MQIIQQHQFRLREFGGCEMLSRLSWPFAVICASLLCTGARAEDPRGLAFNFGVYSRSEVEDLKARGAGDVIRERSVGPETVRHLRIASLEGSKKTTRDHRTLFLYVQSLFVPTLQGGRSLVQVSAEFVALNAEGQLAEPVSQVIKFKQVAVQGRLEWEKSIERGRAAREFHDSLPVWAKTKLHQVSGFLHQNPGSPAVRYEQTGEEHAVALLGVVASLAPASGLLKGVVGEVVENAFKEGGMVAIKKLVVNRDLRSGVAGDIENATARQYSDLYTGVGAKMWNW